MASAATPEAGFADGDGDYARFDGPSGLAAAEDGTVFVADTNNHLVPNKHVLGVGFAGSINRVHRLPCCGRPKMRNSLRGRKNQCEDGEPRDDPQSTFGVMYRAPAKR